MSDHINLTEAGSRYFQMLDLPYAPPSQKSKKAFFLPSLNKQNFRNPQREHAIKLKELPTRLNKIFKQDTMRRAKKQADVSIEKLRKELLRDVGHGNQYISQRAQIMASTMFHKMHQEKHSLLTEVSKNRNYLARINDLHRNSNQKYREIERQIQCRSQISQTSEQ